MDSRIAPDVMTGWIYARNFLGELYECEYLADTWPERLGLDDLAALQTGGKDYPVFEAWNTCLRKAAESVELVTCKEFWWLSSDEPSEYWTRKKQRKILIPPCHKSQSDDILFFNGGALERDTVSPKDFAEYLKKHDKQPSKYIAAWFCAYGVDIETDKTSDETEPVEKIRVLIPMQRAKTELLTLIYNFLSGHCKIEVGDKKPMDSKAAWGLLVSEKYKSDIIRDIQGRRGTSTITLNNETEVDYKEFAKTYNERFKPPQ